MKLTPGNSARAGLVLLDAADQVVDVRGIVRVDAFGFVKRGLGSAKAT